MKAEQPLVRRIEDFFLERPDEWVLLEDLALKFGCTARQADSAFRSLQRSGLLECTKAIRVKDAWPILDPYA